MKKYLRSNEDLPGVGPAAGELRKAEPMNSSAGGHVPDLAEQAELGEAVAGKIINPQRKWPVVDSSPV